MSALSDRLAPTSDDQNTPDLSKKSIETIPLDQRPQGIPSTFSRTSFNMSQASNRNNSLEIEESAEPNDQISPLSSRPAVRRPSFFQGQSIGSTFETSNLRTFRNAVGINIESDVTTSRPGTETSIFGGARDLERMCPSGIHNGLYAKVLQKHNAQLVRYHTFEGVLTCCTILQLIFDAVLTATVSYLPQAKDYRISILGALCTVLAGFVALLRMISPDRWRLNARELEKVADYIVARESQLGAGIGAEDKTALATTIQSVFAHYLLANEIVEKNHPESYNRATETAVVPAPKKHKQ